MAVRHISAEDKKQALAAATKAMQQLTFEFKHPVVVQRAMYGLATAQIEGRMVWHWRWRHLTRLQTIFGARR